MKQFLQYKSNNSNWLQWLQFSIRIAPMHYCQPRTWFKVSRQQNQVFLQSKGSSDAIHVMDWIDPSFSVVLITKPMMVHLRDVSHVTRDIHCLVSEIAKNNPTNTPKELKRRSKQGSEGGLRSLNIVVFVFSFWRFSIFFVFLHHAGKRSGILAYLFFQLTAQKAAEVHRNKNQQFGPIERFWGEAGQETP